MLDAVPASIVPALDAVPASTVPVLDAVTAPIAPVLDTESATPVVERATLRGSEPGETDEASGIHKKTVLPVAAPANREALLARLRGRRVG
jgi:hypothetical protein